MDKEEIQELIREEIMRHFSDTKLLLTNHVQLLDGRNFQTGKTTGTKIATETSQKIAFHGSTPVVQGSTISDPSGGGTQDAEARTAINALIDRLEDKGIIST